MRHGDALVQLLDPPLDRSNLNPGFIRGYVRGLRENGGQYTHGAVGTAMAFAALGDAERAWELLTMINPVNHVHCRYPETLYDITVSQMRAIDPGRSDVTSITVDGVEQADRVITLVDDRREHLVSVSVYVQ